MLQILDTQFGFGGSGLDNKLPGAIKELQGLKFAVLAGAAANTKMALAGLATKDTLVGVLEFVKTGGNVTNIVNRTATATISPLAAKGTLTLAGVVAGDSCVVRGITYTFRAAGTADPLKNEVSVGANDTATAANLVTKLMFVDPVAILATSAAAVVTISATVEGVTGNSYTLVGNAHITASAATLAGGNAAPGLQLTTDSTGNQLVVAYFDKTA